MAKGILGRIAAFFCRESIIIHTVHGPTFPTYFPFWKRYTFWFVELLCGLITDYFIFVGNECRDQFIDSGIASRNKCFVVKSGRPEGFEREPPLNLSEYTKYNVRDRIVLGVVGRVVPQKGHKYALIALKYLVTRLKIPPLLVLWEMN